MNTEANYNPRLKAWKKHVAASSAGSAQIERPGQFQNIVWQTRARLPSEYELALASALEAAFANGATELEAIVEQLNAGGTLDQRGQAWTAESFRLEMAALA